MSAPTVPVSRPLDLVPLLPTLREVRAARPRFAAQVVLCPTCTGPLPGLLAICWKPDCLSADIAEDAAFTEPEMDE